MKDDYLWDKTGDADPQIEHLERVLGQLRGKRDAQSLMPAFDSFTRTRRRAFPKALLIAASLVFALLSLGAFAVIERGMKRQSASAVVMLNPAPPEQTLAPRDAAPLRDAATVKQESDEPAYIEVSNTRPTRSVPGARRRSAARTPLVSEMERERAEGMMAKEQLIKALEITSSKLDVVQKKVQGKTTLGPSS